MGKILTIQPSEVSPQVLRACEELSIEASPRFVAIRPDATARINKCIFNVAAAASAGRGDLVTGWKIQVWPGVLVEFIGHAVLGANDDLLCITPDRYGETRILFAPDPRISFDFSDPLARMPNRLVASTRHDDVAAFIRLEEQMYAMRTTYPPRSGALLLTGPDADRFERLKRAQRAALRDISLRTLDPESACVCDSGRSFKECCRNGMRRERARERAV
jgi:hypothetical protein